MILSPREMFAISVDSDSIHRRWWFFGDYFHMASNLCELANLSMDSTFLTLCGDVVEIPFMTWSGAKSFPI